jgi:hypothetical protein
MTASIKPAFGSMTKSETSFNIKEKGQGNISLPLRAF